METDRKRSFILYLDYKKPLELLSDEQRGQLLLALFDYIETGEVPTLEAAAEIAFSFIQMQIDRDAQKYVEQCEKNRANGTRGGRPSSKTDGIKEKQEQPKESERFSKKPKKTERLLEKPKKPDNDNDDDNDISIENTDVFSSTEQFAKLSEEAVFWLPLVDKSEYGITQPMIDEWSALYPAVDVMQDLRGMKGWLQVNSSKKKTRKGINRFINGWLSRTQDRGGNRRDGQFGKSGTAESGGGSTGNIFADLALEVGDSP